MEPFRQKCYSLRHREAPLFLRMYLLAMSSVHAVCLYKGCIDFLVSNAVNSHETEHEIL